MPSPDYSPFAEEYARSRPGYPAELFQHLASLSDRRDLAWDCATGSGQAALALADHFEKVIATDRSAEQIGHAAPHPRIEYRVAAAEQSGLDDGSVDLVTVASAVHWFHIDAFASEVRRVTRPGGLLAVWTYHVGYVEAPFDGIFERFYREVLSPYFSPGARLVDDRYESLELPGESVPMGSFFVSAAWTLDQMLGFIRSWSGTQQYIKERGHDPVDRIRKELESLWGECERVHTVRWPLFARASRL